ncbi:hypothetical protein M2281_005230 [Mesorhizobium soli]|nr:hypothetical protein [Mesorhizobium soli]MDH6234612.1 hypothetical protein [Mesorhizobium soli]
MTMNIGPGGTTACALQNNNVAAARQAITSTAAPGTTWLASPSA